MSAADSDTEVSAAEEVLEEEPPTEPPPAVPAPLTLEELQRQIAELTVRHTKDVADLANRNKDLELELLRERDSRREAETQLLKKQFAEGSKGKDKEIDLDSETNWRKLEEYYDSLAYVPVSRFQSRIPFTGPDPRHLLERRFKGKSQLLTKRLLVLDCSDKKECLDLLQAYLDVRQHVRGCKHFWELPSSKRWLASSIDDMLQRVLKLLPHHVPPPGCTWTGHSLRSGAASAGYAVTKDLLVICHYGGWARGSDVMQDDYIDPSWRSTPDARVATVGRVDAVKVARSSISC
ncbi:hypothetical protein RI054_06g33090 [Pseudoscourfieldia marina]